MKKILFVFAFAALSLFACAEEIIKLHYTLISPPAYTNEWQAYLDMRAGQRPDVAFTLKNAAEIYESYPFDPAAVDGAPRNPAESIHAWIRNEMKNVATEDRGKYYFVLGGSFTDAQTITAIDDARLNKYIPSVYVRPRFAPDANIQVGEPYYSISDMFYACLDVKEGEWPWDSNGNGKYADNQELGNDQNDYYADVVVSRIPVEKHPKVLKEDGSNEYRDVLGSEVINAFTDKVRRAEADDFAGKYRFALAGGQSSDKDGRISVSDSRTLRDEREFYDGGLNQFDPRHGGLWMDSEFVPRNTIKNTTAKNRPVIEGNPMFVYGWGANHATIDDAVSYYYSHDYDYMEYRDHGSAEDLYCKYINKDAYLGATGITRMIISGFSCMTGYIDGPGISLAEAEIISLKGGTVASVHNNRFGVNWSGTSLVDKSGLTSALQYMIKQRVLENNLDLGQAWLKARQEFYSWKNPLRRDAVDAEGGTGRFVMMEQLLLGDPLIKLSPAIEDTTIEEAEIDVDKDIGYTTLNVKGDTTISGDHLFKVMQGLNVTSSGDLTFAADGGVGGSGVVFEKGNGILTIASQKKSYFTQPTGAMEVAIVGSGTVLDFGTSLATKDCEFKFYGEGGAQTGNVLRGCAEGQLKNLLPLSIEDTEVALGTFDAFRGAESDVFGIVRNGALGITFNPNYGLENSWEYLSSQIGLNYSSLFVDRTTTAGFGRPDNPGLMVYVNGNCSVKTMNGGKATLFGTSTFNLADGATLTFDAALVPDSETDGRLVINKGKTIVANEVGLRGEVIVSGGTLELTKIPLVNVTKLTLLSDSKLILPYDEGGFYQILENGATLELNDAKIYSSDNLDEPIVGELTTTCAFFDASKFLVWNNKGGGNWNLASNNQPWKRGNDKVAYTAGMKVCFPDIAYSEVNQVHAIDLTEELNCEYAYFGNATQKYKFTGEKLNLQNLQVGTDVEFANEVYAPRGTIAATGAKLMFAILNTPSLDVESGAIVEVGNISSEISAIKGFRFVPLEVAQPGGDKLSVSELKFNNKDGKIDLSLATITEADGVGATSTYLEKAWDGKVGGIQFAQGELPWSVSFEDSSVMANGQYYLQFIFENPIPMISSYLVGATFRNQATESIKAWRVDVTIDGETWVTVSQVDKVIYPGTGFNELWVNGGALFTIQSVPTDITIAEGGMLLLAGSATAKIKLEEGSMLKAGSGAMTLGTGSKIVVPEEGYAIIDVSDLELKEIDEEGLTVLTGVTLTEQELAHLTTRGKPWLMLVLEEGVLKLKVDKKPPKVLFR